MGGMLFQVQWLITIWKQQSDIHFLIDASSEEVARTICADHSIAVFGLLHYTQSPEEFGSVYFRFVEKKETVTIYTQFAKSREVFAFFRAANFHIRYINNLRTPISDADVALVINKLEAD